MIKQSKDEESQTKVFRDQKTQEELNAPLSADGAKGVNQDFLEMLIKLVDEGKIDLYRPDTLINHNVYDKLEEEKQGKADLEAVNMLSAVRQIKDLYENGFEDSFQMENLVHRLRVSKERLEEKGGDLFII